MFFSLGSPPRSVTCGHATYCYRFSTHKLKRRCEQNTLEKVVRYSREMEVSNLGGPLEDKYAEDISGACSPCHIRRGPRFPPVAPRYAVSVWGTEGWQAGQQSLEGPLVYMCRWGFKEGPGTRPENLVARGQKEIGQA